MVYPRIYHVFTWIIELNLKLFVVQPAIITYINISHCFGPDYLSVAVNCIPKNSYHGNFESIHIIIHDKNKFSFRTTGDEIARWLNVSMNGTLHDWLFYLSAAISSKFFIIRLYPLRCFGDLD